MEVVGGSDKDRAKKKDEKEEVIRGSHFDPLTMNPSIHLLRNLVIKCNSPFLHINLDQTLNQNPKEVLVCRCCFQDFSAIWL